MRARAAALRGWPTLIPRMKGAGRRRIAARYGRSQRAVRRRVP
ncbi:hypothetical protein [Methanothrix harundinacea]|nr:hypothetical protein [Methanothrix harundinacea]